MRARHRVAVAERIERRLHSLKRSDPGCQSHSYCDFLESDKNIRLPPLARVDRVADNGVTFAHVSTAMAGIPRVFSGSADDRRSDSGSQ